MVVYANWSSSLQLIRTVAFKQIYYFYIVGPDLDYFLKFVGHFSKLL